MPLSRLLPISFLFVSLLKLQAQQPSKPTDESKPPSANSSAEEKNPEGPAVDAAKVTGSTFDSQYFKFTCELPKDWKALDDAARVAANRSLAEEEIERAKLHAAGKKNDPVFAEAAGVLIMPPYFYHYSDAQLLEFYRQFARAIGGQTRIYLYNVPLFTNPISGSLAIHLLGTGAFAGIKDSSGDWPLFETLRDLRDKMAFTLLVGSESIYLRSRSAGADGIVSGVAAAIPELFVAIERAIRSHDCERAMRLNARLEEFTRWIEKFPATVGIKQAAVARGWKLNEFAFPLDDDTQAELAGFHHWLRGWLPGMLSECSEVARKSVG